MLKTGSEYNVQIDHIPKDEWSHILLEFDDATIYQTWSYGDVRWGEKNLSHLILTLNGEIVGAAQIVTRTIPYLRAGAAFIPWGPLWKKRGGQRVDHFHHLLKSLQDEYVSRRGFMLRINPHIVDDDAGQEIVSVLSSEGFQRNSAATRYRSILVDLHPPLSDIRKRLDQKWRNQLNRAEKNGLRILDGTRDQLYSIFLNLQGQMMQRKEYRAGVDYGEFGEIQKDLPDFLKMNILICEYEGEPVTATIASAIGNTGIYLLGATGDKGLQVKGAYLSQWLMIQWMKEKGCRWYDLGGIDPENNPGVYHFKSGLSGREVQHIGQYDRCASRLSNILMGLYTLKKNIQRE